MAGIDAMITSLYDLEAGIMKTRSQWCVDNPKLYLRKDYHPRQVLQLYEKLETGLISDYAHRDPKPEIELVH